MNKNTVFKSSLGRLGCLFLSVFLMGFSSSQYKKTYKTWTRSDEVYQREDFHASFKWHATRLSPEFIQSWAEEYAHIYDLNQDQQVAYSQDLDNKYSGQNVFFVVFYSYNNRESDLAKKDSIWQLSLKSQSEKLSPVKIEKLSKPNSFDKRIFKDLDTWSTGYFVYFPKFQSETQGYPITLSIHGPTGHGDLSWKKL